MELNLKTNYKTTGNSNDEQISTLAIAVDGRDFNGIYEYCDLYYGESEVSNYVINEFDFEPHFIKSLDKSAKNFYKQEIKQGRTSEYDTDLEKYIEERKEYLNENYDSDIEELDNEINKARGNYYDDQFKEWVNGDFYGNFDGILSMANKRYGVNFVYDMEKDLIEIEEDRQYLDKIEELIEDGEIEKEEDFKDYIEEDIYQDAVNANSKNIAESKARAEEYKKTREYQEKQAEENEKARQARILKNLQ